MGGSVAGALGASFVVTMAAGWALAVGDAAAPGEAAAGPLEDPPHAPSSGVSISQPQKHLARNMTAVSMT